MEEIQVTYKDSDKAALQLTNNSVDLLNSSALQKKIEELISSGRNNLAFDMNGVTAINSSGLGVLISCLKKIKSQGGTLRIVNASDKVSDIFKLTKLNTVFDFGEVS